METSDESAGADGIFFDVDLNSWVGKADVCQNPIPRDFPESAASYALNRAICSSVQRESPSVESAPVLFDGYMIGAECLPRPTELCICGRSGKEAVQYDDGVFVLRTYLGAVKRQKRKAVCVCGHTLHWNPGDEFIHTINNGTEGGDSLILYFFLSTLA